MPKKILYESAVHQFLMATKQLLEEKTAQQDARVTEYQAFISSWNFSYEGPHRLRIKWSVPFAGEFHVNFSEAKFYTRGDTDASILKQKENQWLKADADRVSDENRNYFKKLALEVLEQADKREKECPKM